MSAPTGFVLADWAASNRARAKKHDCGAHGELTVREIARLAGLCENTIYGRIDRGIRGDALAAPRSDSRRRHTVDYHDPLHVPSSASAMIFIACRLAQKFRDKPPSVPELRAKFGMSRATAYRWRRAWLDAMAYEGDRA